MNKQNQKWTSLFLAWVVSLVAMLGSLYFSEVRGYIPCALCWYQRIAMYPLVLILFSALFPFERKVIRFAFPLASVGWLISLYHNLLQLGLIETPIQTCKVGVSCKVSYIQWFGFVTIPVLSFTAFTLILILLFKVSRTR